MPLKIIPLHMHHTSREKHVLALPRNTNPNYLYQTTHLLEVIPGLCSSICSPELKCQLMNLIKWYIRRKRKVSITQTIDLIKICSCFSKQSYDAANM